MNTKGKVAGIIANLVIIEVDGPVSQNEICYIKMSDVKLMAEVIRIGGKNIYVQVFESTRGLKTGTEVEFTGYMLEATLGPGILSKNYDGLQHDLDKMEGVFLKKGDYTAALEAEKILGRKPEVLLFNGLSNQKFPTVEETSIKTDTQNNLISFIVNLPM